MTVKRRSYVSPSRKASAANTRRAVLAAAHELFVAQGFLATTIEQIADRAGVSKPTVFAAVGNKTTLLKEVRDVALAGDDAPVRVGERDWYRQMLAAPEATEVLQRYAAISTDISARYAEIDEVLHAATGLSDELRQLWETSESQRLRGATAVVTNVEGKARLRASRRWCIDLAWNLTAPDHYTRLVRQRRWSKDRFEAWLSYELRAQVLQDPHPAPRPPASER